MGHSQKIGCRKKWMTLRLKRPSLRFGETTLTSEHLLTAPKALLAGGRDAGLCIRAGGGMGPLSACKAAAAGAAVGSASATVTPPPLCEAAAGSAGAARRGVPATHSISLLAYHSKGEANCSATCPKFGLYDVGISNKAMLANPLQVQVPDVPQAWVARCRAGDRHAAYLQQVLQRPRQEVARRRSSGHR